MWPYRPDTWAYLGPAPGAPRHATVPPRDPLPHVDYAYDRYRNIWLDAYECDDGMMTATQALYARHLFHPTSLLSISDLAYRIGTSVPNASRTVKRMERHRLVLISIGEFDARTRHVELTDLGRSQYGRLMRRWRHVEARARLSANTQAPARDATWRLR